MQHDVETVLSQSSRGELWVCVWGLAPGEAGMDGWVDFHGRSSPKCDSEEAPPQHQTSWVGGRRKGRAQAHERQLARAALLVALLKPKAARRMHIIFSSKSCDQPGPTKASLGSDKTSCIFRIVIANLK